MEPRTYYKPGHDPVTAVSPSAGRLLEADGYTLTPPAPEPVEDDAAGVTVAGMDDDDDDAIPFATPLPKRQRRKPSKADGVL